MRISLPKKRRLIDDEVLDHNSFARSDLLDEKGWKGRIELHVRPITFRREISYTQGYPPTNICKYIGASDLFHGDEFDGSAFRHSEQRNCRLYFNKYEYPPPANLSEGGSCPMFVELKNYIRTNAERCGSPVICKGGKGYKMFTCNKKYTDSRGRLRKCPFCFQVRWDKDGYYIHLLHPGGQKYTHCSGQAWHCCRPKSK